MRRSFCVCIGVCPASCSLSRFLRLSFLHGSTHTHAPLASRRHQSPGRWAAARAHSPRWRSMASSTLCLGPCPKRRSTHPSRPLTPTRTRSHASLPLQGGWQRRGHVRPVGGARHLQLCGGGGGGRDQRRRQAGSGPGVPPPSRGAPGACGCARRFFRPSPVECCMCALVR
jgi:hypothetical protein